MGWSYRAHYFARYGVNKECLDYCPERVTYATFQQWKVLFEADPERWIIHTQPPMAYEKKYRLPAYKKVIVTSTFKKIDKYHYIKFTTRRDYRRFNRFVKRLTNDISKYENLRSKYENLRELTALTQEIEKIAAEHTQAALDEEKKITEQQRQLIEQIKQIGQEEGWTNT